VVVDAEGGDSEAWIRRHREDLRIMSAGRMIEIYKGVGPPKRFVEDFRLHELSGTHGLGHTRMATESRVTTGGSHPFSTGLDLCLAPNGSLSNQNRLREKLGREGLTFQTENNTEVAAAYLSWRLREGTSLEQALESCLDDLDGFYTFLVGTADGFAVLRDPIACKPAVIAETDDWVAMAPSTARSPCCRAPRRRGCGSRSRASSIMIPASARAADRKPERSAGGRLRTRREDRR
jgi:glutamate synthase domain-containing protein 1